MELLQCTATPLGGIGQCNSCSTLPHCLGVVGKGTPTMHCHTAWGRWAVEFLQWAGPPARGRGVLPKRRSLPMECLRGTAAPIGAGPSVGGTGSPAHAAVAAYGAFAGDGNSQTVRAH